MHMGNRCTLKILLISAREWGVPDAVIERLRHAGLMADASAGPAGGGRAPRLTDASARSAQEGTGPS